MDGTSFGTAADASGRFSFRIPEGTYPVVVSAVGFESARDTVSVRKGQRIELDVALVQADLGLGGEAVVRPTAWGMGAGVSTITPAEVRAMPTPVADALRAVKVQLGVTSNNELSNAYSVRGGSSNENQFFIDGFEIYRPIRTEQGEQEGLGLVNGDLAEGLTLYAGGFPVRYGGKLASVLDVTYARPEGAVFGTAYASTLDGGAAIQGEAGPLGIAVASRISRPQSFLGGQELKGDYDPDFRDVQGVADLDLGGGHRLRGVGLAARHRYRFQPQSRVTTFGIFPDLVRTAGFDYEGSENDGYDVLFGGLRLETPVSRAFRMEHSLSAYDTDEFEQVDISSTIQFSNLVRQPGAPPGEFDRIPSGAPFTQREFADNTVGVATVTGGGRYLLQIGRGASELGWQVRGLRFSDRIDERSEIEYETTGGETAMFTDGVLVAAFDTSAVQVGAWGEQAVDLLPERGRLVATAGVRTDYYDLTDEWTVSPRLAAVLRAGSATTLTAAAGVYHQAPTYRELRGEPDAGSQSISINTDLKSQRATIGVLGIEHLFTQTRLTLRAEAYYKQLDDLISYTVDNVRVGYSGENDSEGYATGLDVQLRGELVPGLESWVNYGFLITEERFFTPSRDDFASGASGDAAFARAMAEFERNGGGDWVRRPTDRRHNLSIFVQDRIPGDDTWSLHLRSLYGSRLPDDGAGRGLRPRDQQRVLRRRRAPRHLAALLLPLRRGPHQAPRHRQGHLRRAADASGDGRDPQRVRPGERDRQLVQPPAGERAALLRGRPDAAHAAHLQRPPARGLLASGDSVRLWRRRDGAGRQRRPIRALARGPRSVLPRAQDAREGEADRGVGDRTGEGLLEPPAEPGEEPARSQPHARPAVPPLPSAEVLQRDAVAPPRRGRWVVGRERLSIAAAARDVLEQEAARDVRQHVQAADGQPRPHVEPEERERQRLAADHVGAVGADEPFIEAEVGAVQGEIRVPPPVANAHAEVQRDGRACGLTECVAPRSHTGAEVERDRPVDAVDDADLAANEPLVWALGEPRGGRHRPFWFSARCSPEASGTLNGRHSG